jgi:8-oxo-dGTP pyrophosphatase MutT (NUDIX family)
MTGAAPAKKEGRPSRLVAALPVWLREGVRLVCLVTSRGTGRWIVPKGKRRRKERAHACAERECREEAGALGRVRGKPVAIIKAEPDGPASMPLYLLEVRQVLEAWPEQHQRRRAWYPADRAAAMVDDPALAAAILRLAALMP